MTVLPSGFDGSGPFGDWGSLWDMAFAMLLGVPASHTFPMPTGQVWDEFPGFLIDELVDGFVRNGLLGGLPAKEPRDLFRRQPLDDLTLN